MSKTANIRRKSSQRGHAAISVLAAITVLGGLATSTSRKSASSTDLKTEVNSLTTALCSPTAEGLFGRVSQEERAASNLTEAKLKQIHELLMGPALRNSEQIAVGQPEQSSNTYQATCTHKFRDQNLREWTFTGLITDRFDTVYSPVLFSIVWNATRFDEAGNLIPNLSRAQRTAKLEAIADQLEGLGASRVFIAPGKTLTWDSIVEKQRAGIGAPQSPPGVDTKSP